MCMTTEELRKEIHRMIDSLPDYALPQVLDYLKSINESQMVLKEIVSQNPELFKKLADN